MTTKKSPINVVSLTQDLVKIESENNHEDGVRIFIENKLQPFGFKFYRHKYAKGRMNLFALLEKQNESELILFSGHMDTVPGYHENRSNMPEIRGDYLYGRGSCDMKGGIASFISAVIEWLSNNSMEEIIGNRGILLGFTVDEEDGCQGVDKLEESSEILNLLARVSFCILAEPSNLEFHIGHKGINRYEVKFHGKAAHSSVPEQGVNAIYLASAYIQFIQNYNNSLQEITSPIGSPKISVNIIGGGVASNVVPDKCFLKIDRRYAPGEDPLEDISKLKNFALTIDPNVDFVSVAIGYPYYLPEGKENPILLDLLDIIPESNIGYLPAYTEADIYSRKYGIPTIIMGPGDIRQAHKTPEFVEISQLHDAVDFYMRILDYFLFNS